MSDEQTAAARSAAESGAAAENSVRRPPRNRFLVWLTFVLLAALLPIAKAADPISFSTATQQVSAAVVNRVVAPLYGYEPDAPDHVALSTRSVAVVLIDDKALQDLHQKYPLDYFFQFDMFSRLMQFEPRAIFVDLLYSYDRGDLATAVGLIKEEADATETEIVFASINQTIDWSSAETHQLIRDNFQTASVALEQGSTLYPLWNPRTRDAREQPGSSALTRQGGDATYVASAAITMLQLACRPGWGGGRDEKLPGCLAANDLAGEGVRPDKTPPLALRYGSLNQEAWQPYGLLSGLRGEAFYEKAKELKDGCHHFPPDLTGRAWEAAQKAFISIQPFRVETPIQRCPYPLTIPLEQLMDDSKDMNEYLAAALKDKIVFLGSSVVGAHDRVPMLDSYGPGVLAHAMATDNLLRYGQDYMREPPAALSLEIAGAPFAIGRDIVFEMAISVLFALWASFLATATRRWAKAGRGGWINLRSLLVGGASLLFTVAIVVGSLALAMLWLRWSSPNWIGAIAYGLLLRELLDLAEERLPEESS